MIEHILNGNTLNIFVLYDTDCGFGAGLSRKTYTKPTNIMINR